MAKPFYQADLTDSEFEQNYQRAVWWYKQGVPCKWSKGICDSITAGYGRLDEYGYWEFPLRVRDSTVVVGEE